MATAPVILTIAKAGVYGSNLAIVASNIATYSCNAAIFSCNAAFYASNTAYNSSNAAYNSSNTAYDASNTAYYASNTAYHTSNTAYNTTPVDRGGTGATTLTAGKVLVGNNTGIVLQPVNLHWDDGNGRLGIGTTAPTSQLELSGTATAMKAILKSNLDVGNVPASTGTATIPGTTPANSQSVTMNIPNNQKLDTDPQFRIMALYSSFPGTVATVNGLTGKQIGASGLYILSNGYTIYNGGSSVASINIPAFTGSDTYGSAAYRAHRIYFGTGNFGQDFSNGTAKFNSDANQSISFSLAPGASFKVGVSVSDFGASLGFSLYDTNWTLEIGVVVSYAVNVAGTVNVLAPAGGAAVLGLSSNLTVGQTTNITVGKATTNKNSAIIRYTHSADGATANAAQFGLWGVNNLTCLASGRVGIMNTSPAYALDVTGDMNASGTLYVNGTSTATLYAAASHTHAASAITSGTIDAQRLPKATTTTVGIVQLVDETNNASTAVVPTANAVKLVNDAVLLAAAAGTSGSNAGNWSSNQVVWTKGPGAQATIMSSNIGIRTDTPAYALDVTGDINASGALYVNGTSTATLYAAATHTHAASEITSGTIDAQRLPSATTAAAGIVQLVDDTNNESTDMVPTANAVKLVNDAVLLAAAAGTSGSNAGNWSSNQVVWTKGPGAQATIMSSNIGIQTTTPSYALDVTGDINVTGSFRQNGIVFVGGGSQWTTSEANIYYTTDSTLTSGAVGIGKTAPSYKLDVAGDIYASQNIIAYSDARDKTLIQAIEGALDKVRSIRGVTYSRLSELAASESSPSRRYAGVLAQEVREVLPEVVCEDGEGRLSVAYGNISALLIEAIKELAAIVEARL
jgi:membrane-bound inhibitor of C-type lysozyme